MQDKYRSVSEPSRGPYHPMVKAKALKLLLDYSRTTGRKWTIIRKEIIALTGLKVSNSSPVFVRQDLENWAKGSILSDDKFRWIFAFLTHSSTISRPEFAAAKGLIDPIQEIISNGNILLHYTDTRFIEAVGLQKEHATTEEKRIYIYNFISGHFQFLRSGIPKRSYLIVTQIEGQKFLRVHLLEARSDKKLDYDDWNLTISDGYAIIGDPISFYLANSDRSLNMSISIGKRRPKSAPIHGIYNDACFFALEKSYRQAENTEGDIDVWISHGRMFELQRIHDDTLQKIVDDILWRSEN